MSARDQLGLLARPRPAYDWTESSIGGWVNNTKRGTQHNTCQRVTNHSIRSFASGANLNARLSEVWTVTNHVTTDDEEVAKMSSSKFATLLRGFDPTRPIEESPTPPASWYVDPDFLDQEVATVFEKSWVPVGRVDQLENVGDYFTGEIVGNPFVVSRGDDGELHAVHNVCRHKGAIVAQQEDESRHNCEFFQCPYHGWQYHLDGRLKKAPMLGPQAEFDRGEYGLPTISVKTWGPFVFLDLDGPRGGEFNPRDLMADIDSIREPLERANFDQLKFYKRYAYDLKCNWKVFVDNSLDGGYHVKYAHAGLAQGLQLDEFKTHIFDRSSIQICDTKGSDTRLGDRVMYAYLYPNFFINRYGNMMDTNIVMPLGVDRCRIIFDFYFDVENMDTWEVRQQMLNSVMSSHAIQEEDIEICESAQHGMKSISWQTGRYSSILETAVHAFHVLLHRDLSSNG